MRSPLADLGILAGAFVGATLLAELLGAANLGTALTFGQIAFMAAVLALMVVPAWRSQRDRPAQRPRSSRGR
jgi:hypothetical protein